MASAKEIAADRLFVQSFSAKYKSYDCPHCDGWGLGYDEPCEYCEGTGLAFHTCSRCEMSLHVSEGGICDWCLSKDSARIERRREVACKAYGRALVSLVPGADLRVNSGLAVFARGWDRLWHKVREV